jgi:hypothetical protein
MDPDSVADPEHCSLVFICILYSRDSSLGNALVNRGRNSLFLRIVRKWTYIFSADFLCLLMRAGH